MIKFLFILILVNSSISHFLYFKAVHIECRNLTAPWRFWLHCFFFCFPLPTPRDIYGIERVNHKRFYKNILLNCILKIVACVRKLIDRPITTYTHFDFNKTIAYPSISFCREPPYKHDVLEVSDLLIIISISLVNFDKYSMKLT